MANIQIFNNPQFGDIRTAGTPDEPLFCLADVCKALDLTTTKVAQRLSDDVLSKHPIIDSLGRTQDANFITEDGLYDVILDSRKPEAKAFRKWITSEVIPSIRKNGGYIAATAEDTPELIMAKALKLADVTIQRVQEQNRLLTQQNNILEGEKEHLTAENKAMAPKADYFDEVLQSDTTYTFTQVAKELGFSSALKLYADLFKKKVMYKQSDQWMAYAKYADKGYFTTRTARFYHKDGRPGSSISTVITEAGRQWLHSTVYAN